MRSHPIAAPLLLAAAVLVLSGCAASASNDDGAAEGPVRVVASTSVYGDIAEQIGGDLVEVTSIIDDPSQDPHSYEADARVQLSLSKADLVIENGGGYDDFVDTLLDGADNGDATVVNAADTSGYDQEPADGEFNEHLWYDFPTVQKVAERIVAALSDEDSDNAADYQANGAEFVDAIRGLIAREADLSSSYEGTSVAITEPVPGYLLQASGLVNRTPDEFSEAIEEGTDVSPAVLRETLALFADKTVDLLAYNEQTTGPETEELRDAAKANGIAVVAMTETLPEGEDYLSWMTANLDAIDSALGSS